MFDITIPVRLHDEQNNLYYRGEVSLDLGSHGSLRDFTRGKTCHSAEDLVEHMLTSLDTWDLLGDITDASAETLNHVRVETYKIGDKGIFFEIEEQEGIVLSGCLQIRKYSKDYQVSGNLKVITYLGHKEVCSKSTYHPGTYGLWQRGDVMFIAENSYGRLVAID